MAALSGVLLSEILKTGTIAVIKAALKKAAVSGTGMLFAEGTIQLGKLMADSQDPDFLRSSVDFVTDTEIPAAAFLTSLLQDTDFSDFAIGLLLNTITDPIVRARIADPIRDKLDSLYPLKKMSERMVVSAVETGALDPQDLHFVLTDIGVKPSHKVLIERYAAQRRTLRITEQVHRVQTAKASITSILVDRDLDIVERELREVEREMDLIERAIHEVPAREEAAALEARAAKIDGLVDQVQAARGGARDRAVAALLTEVEKEMITPLPRTIIPLPKKASSIGLTYTVEGRAQQEKRQSSIGLAREGA